MKEAWKIIEDYPNYEVSSLGRVRNIKTGRYFNGKIGRGGHYLYVFLCNNGKENSRPIHRLVAESFIPNPDNKPQVNHIDGVKTNNMMENLEWCTAKENNIHAINTGLNNPGAYQKRPVKVIDTGEVFDGVMACANEIGADFRNVYAALNGKRPTVKGLRFEYAESLKKQDKLPFLYDYQMDAVKKMKNGAILNGGVGSGKSRTALAYYYLQNGGDESWLTGGEYVPMDDVSIKNLYIITPPKKRDDYEWEGELSPFLLSTNSEINLYRNKVVVDSWQNIKKYSDVTGAFFIFDENRVIGSGAWVKSFLEIAKRNYWILLSATPGDTYSDYIPVFIANGFYKNRTEFTREHIIYSRFSKFPKVDRYINTGRLIKLRNSILVSMDFKRETVPHHEDVYVSYSLEMYKDVSRTRWNPYKNTPIVNAGELCYIWRRIVNSDESRKNAVLKILENHPRVIIFYNFDYELEILKNLNYGETVEVAEWSGHAHQPIPNGNVWIYLVNYNAGADAWNTIKTDTIIFYSQNYSYRTIVQAAGRIDRLNTPYTDLYYYHLKSRSGIDLAISKALKEKKNFNESKFAKW